MILGRKVIPPLPDPPPEWLPDPDDKKFEISTANPLFKRTKLPLPPPGPPRSPAEVWNDLHPGEPWPGF